MFDVLSSIFRSIVSFFTAILVALGVITPSNTAEQKLVMSISIEDISTCRSIQGGCCDGQYVYVTAINPDGAEFDNPEWTVGCDETVTPKKVKKVPCVILKINPDTWSVVSKSDYLFLDHANDVTYNAANNELVICNNQPNYTTVTTVDPVTLSVRETFTVPQKIYSIVYVGSESCYYAGISGGYQVVKMTQSYTQIGTMSLSEHGNTRQGMDSDGSYLYFVYSDDNYVYKFDLSGNMVAKLELPERNNEAEFIFFRYGTMYIGYEFNGRANGGAIYSVTDIKWDEKK